MATVEDSWRIIRLLNPTESTGITEISQALNISKSSAHTHFSTLCNEDVAVREDGEYRLSLDMVILGEQIKSELPLYKAGRPEVNKLANRTGYYVHLFTYQSGNIIYLYGSGGKKAIAKEHFTEKSYRPGQYHTMAAGKALLAFLPDDVVARIIDEIDLTAYTEYTITDPETLRNELERVRSQGFAINNQEEILGTRAVGAPIFSPDGDLLGAISISKPKARMEGRDMYETVPDQVMEAANAVEARVQELN
jgi:DNA-binding IclR family transcriptional regulator